MPLVILEGIDGSGKSTLATALAAKLGARRASFPSHHGAIGRLIRATFNGVVQVAPTAMQHLFIADALDQEPLVRTWVERGDVVILDRHPTISGWVYETSMPVALVQQVSIPFLFTRPDLVFILDVPTQVAFDRLQERGGADASFESVTQAVMESRRRRYKAYQVMHPNCYLLDGEQPTSSLVAAIEELLAHLHAPRRAAAH